MSPRPHRARGWVKGLQHGGEDVALPLLDRRARQRRPTIVPPQSQLPEPGWVQANPSQRCALTLN
jgi:hypothetical protein